MPRRENDPGFAPFADDAAVRSIGTLTFENGTARIAVHGSLDLPRDREGLERARLLKRTVDAVVAVLEAAELPERVAEAEGAPVTVRNPFA